MKGNSTHFESISVRMAVVEDVPAITEIYNEAILTRNVTGEKHPKSIEDRLKWFESHDEKHPIMVAVENGKVVGWTSLQGYDNPHCCETGTTSLYVHSTKQGLGIGGKLKVAMMEKARQLGFNKLVTEISEMAPESFHINLKTGFVHVDTRVVTDPKSGQLVKIRIMEKSLN